MANGRASFGTPLRPSAGGSSPDAQRGAALTVVDPERALAIAYAPRAARAALTALFALDERLGAIVGTTTEPTIGLVRLAWWREALERLDTQLAPAEPLLRALAEDVLPCGIAGAALAGIEDGWAALLDGEIDAAAIARHGRERGGRLFDAAARLLAAQGEGVSAAGAGWALADLAHRHSSDVVRGEARRQAQAALSAAPRRWPGPLRALGMLAMLAARDAASGGPRHQGAPGRLLRALALRLTGR